MSLCKSCSYFDAWMEKHPYGSTTATEYFEECKIDAAEWDKAGDNGSVVVFCTFFEPLEFDFK